MFGYVVTNSKILSEEDNKIYRAYYCGLCHALKEKYGQISRLTLNYDLTFLAIFLDAVYSLPKKEEYLGCTLHPFSKHLCYNNEIFSYCADMNIALIYYKLLDDWYDDKNIIALFSSEFFKKKIEEIKKKYPRQCSAIEENLKKLMKAEKENILIPDIPASHFGNLMGELFCLYEDKNSKLLKSFGFELGEFIYIIDAVCDIKKDIKQKKYNPLITTPRKDFEKILTLFLAECTDVYNKIEIKNNKAIIDNILYSGIWTKYELKKQRKEKKKERKND